MILPSALLGRLRAGFARPLPGLAAQLPMAPNPRANWDPTTIPDTLTDGAALLLVYQADGALYVPLTVRSGALRHHTGQVSLPGGRVDDGEAIEAAALREAAEEIGLDARSAHVVGRLTPLHIPVSGFLLHVVVAMTEHRPMFLLAEGEVARIIEAPVSRLLDPRLVKRECHSRETPEGIVDVDVPFYEVDGEKVWGATAMVLSEFCAILSAR